jgi:hypothetical protein
MRRLFFIAAIAACAKKEEPKPPPVTPAKRVDAAPAPARDAGPAETSDACWGKVLALFASIHADAVAESPHPADTLAAWKAFPDECKRGGYYEATAMMLHMGTKLDGFATPADAITAGVKADSNDPGLLGYDAYLNGLDATLAPALPPDTCDRVHAAPVPKNASVRKIQDEAIAYACGWSQLVTGAFPDAAQSFGAIEDPPYPDVLLRKVQALIGAKDVKGAQKLARWAKEQFTKYGQLLGVAPGDAKVLASQLTAATK